MTDERSRDGGGWIYLGNNPVKHNRVRVPDAVVEAGILARFPGGNGDDYYAYWSYERHTGVVVVSDDRLTAGSDDRFQGDYVTQDRTKYQSAASNHRLQIPKPFFRGQKLDDERRDASEVPERVVPNGAGVRNGERRHFLTREAMMTGEPASCFFLTDGTLEEWIREPSLIDERFSSAPNFL